MRIEDNQRPLRDLPLCCQQEVYSEIALGDPMLMAGHECPECQAFWIQIAPGSYVMDTMIKFHNGSEARRHG